MTGLEWFDCNSRELMVLPQTVSPWHKQEEWWAFINIFHLKKYLIFIYFCYNNPILFFGFDMHINNLANISTLKPTQKLNRLNAFMRNVSAIVVWLLIIQWWENIIKPQEAEAYDMFASIDEEREAKKELFERKVRQMDLSARDKQTIIENLKLIYEDYTKMKKQRKIDTIKIFNYYNYMNDHLKNAKSFLDKVTYNLYIQMREDMQ